MFPCVSYQNSIMMACFGVGRVTDVVVNSRVVELQQKVALSIIFCVNFN